MDDADESGSRLCSRWSNILKHMRMVNHILNYVKRALGHKQWTSCKGKLDEMPATKNPHRPDGFPWSVYRSGGGIRAPNSLQRLHATLGWWRTCAPLCCKHRRHQGHNDPHSCCRGKLFWLSLLRLSSPRLGFGELPGMANPSSP